ncbi:hypothetical protein Tco_0977917 [Tanacetum coccineum]|uniref:Uncharacterized protein n=1 Tax=Tanacetum coccineum TaxID=301880 RepID=A0ABQ5ELH3_9ASTR
MEDQPLPTDASPTALSSGYIADFDPEEDEEDPEEDPADHHLDGGDNDDNESSDDDDDDDDVVKDEEDEEEVHLAPADPSAFAAALPSSLPPPPENIKSLKDNIRETMTTVNQGMSVEEIERVVAQRVANAIEAIAIYKTKTNMARKSMSQTERQEDKVAENASNKRKWEGVRGFKPKTMQDAIEFVTKLIDKKISTPAERQAENKRKLDNTSKNNQNQQKPNKRQNTGRSYIAGHEEKKHYVGSKPLSLVQKASECPIVKFQKRVDMIHRGVRASKPKIMQDAIEFVTKLMDKKISIPAERQVENKRKFDNTSKNNQNQQ